MVGNWLTGNLLRQIYSGLSGDRLYVVGFSLGAHVAGFAGKNFPGIARISGLEPAGPGYFPTSAAHRLDKTDAKFVDVIHTNAQNSDYDYYHFGYPLTVGHVDFYVNDGSNQPGCDDILGCSHFRAHELYIASFNESRILGYKCSGHEDMLVS